MINDKKIKKKKLFYAGRAHAQQHIIIYQITQETNSRGEHDKQSTMLKHIW